MGGRLHRPDWALVVRVAAYGRYMLLHDRERTFQVRAPYDGGTLQEQLCGRAEVYLLARRCSDGCHLELLLDAESQLQEVEGW